jgi:hypothetical protein
MRVSWRRSVLSCGTGGRGRLRRGWGGVSKRPDRAQHLAAMTNGDAKPVKVLFCQLGKNVEVNVVFGKTLRVLGHTEFFQPVRNLLHRGYQRPIVDYQWSLSEYFHDSTLRILRFSAGLLLFF